MFKKSLLLEVYVRGTESIGIRFGILRPKSSQPKDESNKPLTLKHVLELGC